LKTVVRAQLVTALNPRLVDELLEAHEEAKRNFYLGGDRLSAVEGGRFCEAAFRLLEQITTGQFTPLGTQLDTTRLIRQLENVPVAAQNDSIRLHIPRALRMVYDIRNKRDTAHLADGIDPNVQDSTLVVGTIDWVLAEFIRLYHNVSADDAKRIVEDIVSRKAPVVQQFGDFLKVLRRDLSAGDFCLVLLYHCGTMGATFNDLSAWVHPRMRTNLRRTLSRLGDETAHVHFDGTRYFITRSGQHEVEGRRLVEGQ
jgi:hypothetical protein